MPELSASTVGAWLAQDDKKRVMVPGHAALEAHRKGFGCTQQMQIWV